jgi:putative redox protein
MSFAGCVATTVLYLLRKMGKTVSGLEVNAKGMRPEQPPIKLERIFLEFVAVSQDAGDADMRKAIGLAEEFACPVWQMLKNNVDVVTQYRIV